MGCGRAWSSCSASRYHRQFIEAASDRYTVGETGGALHRDLAELFLAEEGTRRDVTLTYRRNMVVKDADRQVTWQPMTLRNRRMLTALPWHLIRWEPNRRCWSIMCSQSNCTDSERTQVADR